MTEVEEATIKVVVGAEKKSRVMSGAEKKLTAYHEAGHASQHISAQLKTQFTKFQLFQEVWQADLQCPCQARISHTVLRKR